MSDYNIGDRVVVMVEYDRTVADVKSHGGGTDYELDRNVPSGGRKVGWRKKADTKRFDAINRIIGCAVSVAGEIATSTAEHDRIVVGALDDLKALGISGEEIDQAAKYEKARIKNLAKRKK